jgi:hypothetical protein
MEEFTMDNLRDFLYLDTARLYSFVSQIQGGLVNEISETIKQLGGISAGISIGLPSVGGKADASKGKESERQQTMQLTDPAYFNVLYRYLQQNGLIDLTDLSLQTRARLSSGQFVEVQGIADPPVVESWVSQFRSMFDFIEKNLKLFVKAQTPGRKRTSSTVSNQQMREFKAILDCLVDFINISRKDPGRQYIRISSDKRELRVWSGLLPDHVIIPLQSVLPGEVRIFGRVERLLSEGETWKIVDIDQFNQASEAEKLIDMLNSFNAVIGQKPISENDLQAKYPDIFITPVAVYR